MRKDVPADNHWRFGAHTITFPDGKTVRADGEVHALSAICREHNAVYRGKPPLWFYVRDEGAIWGKTTDGYKYIVASLWRPEIAEEIVRRHNDEAGYAPETQER